MKPKIGMKITEAIADRGKGRFSFEYFPAKTQVGMDNLYERLKRMKSLNPAFVTVTWGAGGSTAQKSVDLAIHIQQQLGITTCLHMTCTNMEKDVLDDALRKAKDGGIRNILALRGDPPRGEDYFEKPPSDFTFAADLVRYIRQQYGGYFCIGVAAYPEGHGEGSMPEVQDVRKDLPYLIEKIQAGADFIVTQLFFDTNVFIDFERMLREHSSQAFSKIPILPGLMPINSYSSIRRITKLSHASIPENYISQLEAVKADDGKVKAAGVDILSEIIDDIRKKTNGRIRNFHFYTLNLEKSVSLVLEQSHLLYDGGSSTDSTASAVDGLLSVSSQQNGSVRRASSVNSDPHNRVIVDEIRNGIRNMDMLASAREAGKPAPCEDDWSSSLAISEGEGSLGRAATWDDFPNGRFGDARSPAFGNIDGYGVSLHVSPAQALRLWGMPTCTEDVSSLFVKHINGDLRVLPWSQEGLNPETHAIKHQLINFNKQGKWTVASQPAVNGASSTHGVFGWGPFGGFVFQKAFVEFFVSAEDWTKLRKTLALAEDVTYYAGNSKGEFETSAESGDSNAVTWGVFPGKEIVQPTIIEEVSFRSWIVSNPIG